MSIYINKAASHGENKSIYRPKYRQKHCINCRNSPRTANPQSRFLPIIWQQLDNKGMEKRLDLHLDFK